MELSLKHPQLDGSRNAISRQRDAFVECQPISDEVHEVLQDGFEVVVAGDRDGDVDACTDGCPPDESGDALRPVCQDLDGEGNAVDVGAVVSYY